LKLSAGILNSEPHWIELLNQSGVSFHEININNDLSSYPLIILGNKRNIKKNIFNKYISEGGSVITGTSAAKEVFNISFKRRFIEYIYSHDDEVINIPYYSNIKSSLQIPEGAKYIKCNDDSSLLLIKEIDKGTLVVFPDNFLKLIFFEKSRRKLFHSNYGKEFPSEKVSFVDKQTIHNIFLRILEYLFHKKNLPFVRLWHFPDGQKNIFGFRIDTDFASDDEIKNLYSVLNENKIKATWFVETKSHENNLSIFKEFDNQEIALHCYEHKLYKATNSNLNDIEKGISILKSAGFIPSGYASPFGEWNSSLALAVDKAQFLYSSEFGYVYDSLPVHSLVNNKKSKSLQISVHPISVGRLNIAGHSDSDMIKYYSDIINEKINSYLPVFLYTHPAQKRFEVFDSLFKKINELNISSITFNEYALWWKLREAFWWNPEMEDGRIIYNQEIADKRIWFHKSFKDGRNYLVNSENLSETEIGRRRIEFPPGFNPEYINKFSFNLFKQELIYHYRKLKY